MDKEKNGDDAGTEYCKVNARDFIIPTQVFVIYVPADYLWKSLLSDAEP